VQAKDVWLWASQRGTCAEGEQNLPCQQSSEGCRLSDNLSFVNMLSKRMAKGTAPDRAASLAEESCPMASAKSRTKKSPWW